MQITIDSRSVTIAHHTELGPRPVRGTLMEVPAVFVVQQLSKR